jgi:hypothetical protein
MVQKAHFFSIIYATSLNIMKKTIFFFCMLFALVANIQAQQTFDVFTYTAPADWKKDTKNTVIGYTKTDNKKGTYCVISLNAAANSTGNVADDFASEWDEMVAKPLQVTAAPQSELGETENGWESKSGAANFTFNKSTSMAVLISFTGYDKVCSIRFLTNDADGIKELEAFLKNVTLSKLSTTTTTTTQKSNNNNPNTSNNSILGEWSTSGTVIADYVNHNGQYAGDASSSTTTSYRFNSNGTYEEFFATTTGYQTHTFFYKGKYTMSGNQITTIPTFYEHKLNTKLQPDNDPKNKKSKIFNYSFEFNVDRNIEGLKFKGDDNNFMSSSLMYKVGNTTISATNNKNNNNVSVSNVTAANEAGSGITGVWINYENINRGFANLSWNWKIFFANGKSIQAIPSEGLYNYTVNVEKNLKVGTYQFANGSGTNYKYPEQKSPDKMKLVKPNQLEIDGVVYLKCKAVNGQKLNGSFTSFANPHDTDLENQPIGEKHRITFTNDGKFIDEGIHTFFLQCYCGKDKAYDAAGSGTYELKDFSIILTYNDGRVKQEAFSIPFGNTTTDATIIFLRRGQLNKII